MGMNPSHCPAHNTLQCQMWLHGAEMMENIFSYLVLSVQSTTKDYIRAEHKLHSISKLFISQIIISQVMFFWAYFYSVGTQHGNLHLAGWPILFCGPTQEPCISHSQNRKNRESFGQNAGEWTGRLEIGKEEIPGSKRSMHGYILTHSRL